MLVEREWADVAIGVVGGEGGKNGTSCISGLGIASSSLIE